MIFNLEYFKRKMEEGIYLSDQWICEDLIDEFERNELNAAANNV